MEDERHTTRTHGPQGRRPWSRLSPLLAGLALACSATEGPLLAYTHNVGDGGGDTNQAASEPATTLPFGPNPRLQYQLTGEVNASDMAEVFVVDLFNTDGPQVSALQREDKVVIAYLSAGSFEPFRPDANSFAPDAIGEPLLGFPEEAWLDTRDASVRRTQEARLQLAAERGFDGVFFTSLTAYQADSGHDLSAADQLDYNLWLAQQTHALGLLAGLSGDWQQAASLAGNFDFAIHNGCLENDSCGQLAPFVALGKPVFDLETSGNREDVCAKASAVGIPVTIKQPNYDGWFLACP